MPSAKRYFKIRQGCGPVQVAGKDGGRSVNLNAGDIRESDVALDPAQYEEVDKDGAPVKSEGPINDKPRKKTKGKKSSDE